MERDRRSEDWHVTAELLRAMELGQVDTGVCLTLLLEHLSGLCPACGEGFREFVHSPATAPEAPAVGAVYEPSVDRAAARALEYGELERAAGRERAALRLLSSHEERLDALRSGSSPANPALIELFLEEARSCVHDSPWEAGELAELADVVARRLDVGTYGESFCNDRVLEARAHRANALRAQGELKAAAALLAEVEHRLHDVFDPFLLAELATFKASLAKDQRRFDDALEGLDEAERLFLEVEADYALVARVRLQRASLLSLGGEPRVAVDLAQEVIEGLQETADPELHFIAQHNLVSYLCEAGCYQHARRILTELAPSYQRHPRRSFRIRFHWRQGKIAHGLGEHDTAESEYVAARDAFLHAGLGYDAALVALDLASLYLEQGRTAEVREIAVWTSTLFEAQDIHREALAALALFRRAALEDALTVAQLQRLTRRMTLLRVGSAADPPS